MDAHTPEDILTFWLGPLDAAGFSSADASAVWFRKDEAFDRRVAQQFGKLHEELARGEHAQWLTTPRGRLASVIVLDQFSRNMFRGTPKMFDADPIALAQAQQGIERGDERALAPQERVFLYMPLMHAEDLAAQEACITSFQRLESEVDESKKASIQNNVRFAIAHRDIVARFGRFPHRNEVLGRTSTADEIAFLKTEGSSF